MAKSYRPLNVPSGVEIRISPELVQVKGKLGTLELRVPRGVQVKQIDSSIVVEGESGVERALVGTTRALLRNMFAGVTSGYKKIVELRGMGYRVQKTKSGLQINCGFSHPVDFTIPAGITVEVNQVPNPDDTKEQMFEIIISGIDKQVVGDVAARIRAIKPADPYHGKGFRYRGERVRKKAGKRAVGAQA
ncbi:MAG: 50S ribosomal protein L6 [candidate division WOR-3 bacterium]|uniref:50S ribosomal protein L6 n=1 Tax=candidate division WOR-3 bacterium TaxID=2052148 RepID=A0A7C1NNX4_UNCW3|nr:50S ribosomal protein L6 [candidate division WOR-3 bacterium]